MPRMRELLFPDEPRNFPGRRELKILLRAVHVLCAGVLVGAYLFDTSQMTWLWATVATGSALLLLDLHESASFLLQVRGTVLAGKLALLAALPHFGAYKAYALAFLVIVSVVSSHAPGSFRHRMLFGKGRITASESRG